MSKEQSANNANGPGLRQQTNWANRQKAAVKAVPISSEKEKTNNRGTRHEAVVESITPTTFSTGSTGVKIKYQVAGLSQAVYENIVLFSSQNDDGTRSATRFGESSLKRRFQAVGLQSNEVLEAIGLLSKETNADFSSLAGAHVVVYLKDRTYMGKLYKQVASVYPID
jgi:hypothetical protein